MAKQSGLKRIIIHWTAGASKPNATDKRAYHYLVDSNGNIHNGLYRPEDNINCNDGKYAAHTGGGNTGSIGVSLCGMAQFSCSTLKTPYPLTKIQLESAFSFVAKLCKKYAISIDENSVLTHYEFGLKNPSTSSASKIDILYLPPFPSVHKYEVGNFIRNKVKWYLSRQKTD